MAEEDDDKDDISGSRRRLTDAEFAAAKELYELGKAGIAELAQQYGCARQTLSRRFKDVGAIKGSRAHELAAAQGAAVKATVERFAEKRSEWIEDTRIEALRALKQARLIAQKIAIDALKKNDPLGTVDDDLRAAGRLNKIIADNFTKALEILRSDEHIDEDDLPVLTVEDLTDEDILQHHISTGALEPDATIEDINS